MQLIALRHGQSQYNALGLCNDDPSIPVGLTEAGEAQADAAVELLVTESIDAVFASPLPRAHQTADRVAGKLGITVALDTRLGDIRSGFEGRPVVEYLAAIAHDPVDARVGGESLREYAGRVGGFLGWLAPQPLETVLIVAHEETLRVIKAHCEDLPLVEVEGQPFDNCRPYRFFFG
jgi:probable phosphoglycerate mutase